MESRFIRTGFTGSPQVDNWIIYQLFYLQLSPHHMRGTQTYKLTYIDTQDAMEKILKGKKPCGGFPYLLQGHVNVSKRNSQVRTFSLIL